MARFDRRPATGEDYELVYRMKGETMRPYIEATWGWVEEDQRRLHERRFVPHATEILLVEGEPVGWLHVRRKPEEIVLLSVAVLPAWQSHGIGSAILEELQREAAVGGLPIRLHVLRVNERARALYERRGFRVTETTDTHHEMVFDDPKGIVRQGYDIVSHAYCADEAPDMEARYGPWLDELAARLAPSDTVLELGCGCGIPATRRLAEDYDVTGVDISPVQIERARKLVPDARFLCADMTSLELPAEAYAAVVSLYAIVHVPLGEQQALFRDIQRWLRPGGHLLATVGHRAWTGTEEDWLGAGGLMYWSHADKATYLRWIEAAGFEILWTHFVPEDDSGATLLLARRRD
jgi:SAM-dependent methyltransferase